MPDNQEGNIEYPSQLQRILRYPLILGGVFSSLLFAVVIQISIGEHDRDFTIAAEGAAIDFREHLQEGEMVINGIHRFFNASQHVTKEEFALFMRAQFNTHLEIKSVRFLAHSGGENRYARAAAQLPRVVEVSAGEQHYSLHPLYRVTSSSNDFSEPGWEVWNTPRTLEALGEAISRGVITLGGMVVLDDGSIAFSQYKAIYSREREDELLGVVVVLFRPADVLEHIAEDFRVNGALRVGERAAGFFHCCLQQSEPLLPLLSYEGAFDFHGVPLELTFSRGMSWGDVHMKLAVMAFVIGALLSMVMHRLRIANMERTRLLLERNRTIKRRVEEQTRTLRQLNAELAQEKAAVDEHAIVSIADISGNIIYANEKFCEISGYSSEELLGRNHRLVRSDRHPSAFYDEMWNTISQGKVWHGVVCNRKKDGGEYWVNSTIVPFLDEKGGPYQYVSIRTDVTPLMSAEAALARSEGEVTSILDTVPALIWYKDRDSRIVRANRAAAALAGRTPEEMAGRPHSEFFPPEAVARYRADDLCVLESGEPLLDKLDRIEDEAGTHYFRVDRVPYCNESGETIGLIVVAHDVTEQEKAERTLQVNEERLRRSQTFANIGTWDWDIQNGDLFWSERIAPLFGYEVGELETTYENFLNAVHPDDRELVSSAVGACVESGAEYNIEHRVVWPDGQVRWLSEKGDVVRDADGNPLHMLGVVSDIHDRKMAEQALQESEAVLSESEEKFRSLYEMSPVGIALNGMDGSFIEANQAFLDIVGYTSDECRALTYWELTPQEYEMQEAVQLESLSTSGRYGPYEKEYTHKDGHRVDVLLNGTIIHDREGEPRIWSIVQDITERKQAEIQLNRFKTTLDVTQDCVFMFDAEDLRFFYVNQGAMEQVGYSKDELMQMHPYELKPDYDEASFRELVEPMIQGGGDSVTFDTIHQHKSGALIPVEIALQYIAPEGEQPRFVAIVRNIAERKQMQQNLVEAKEAAEQASKAKSEFLSSMSHELRTPLNAIIGFTQLMEGDENLTGEQREGLHDISNAGTHLLELINGVLDLAKIEAGRMELSISSVAVADVMMAGQNLIGPMAEKSGLRLSFSEACFNGYFVQADFTRVKQVLLNLLSNAVKYNRENGAIYVECEQRENGRLRISVRDSGKGIPELKLQGLFEAFNRLDAEGSNIEGTGIGLVITRQLVELMGGEIGVQSQLGEGSTFWFELPFTEYHAEKDRRPDESSAAVDKSLGQGKKVLYIEDNPVNLKLVSKMIEKRTSIELLSAEEPVAGIELAVNNRPHLILLDINLPGMSGFEVLKVLRAKEETRDIPVYALSANAMAADLRKGEEAGFSGYLTKPINAKEFFGVLQQRLG